MASLGPLFCDITWGAGGTTADLTLEIAARMQRDVGVETMMHLTCTNMPVEQLDDALDKVREWRERAWEFKGGVAWESRGGPNGRPPPTLSPQDARRGGCVSGLARSRTPSGAHLPRGTEPVW